MVPAAGRKRRGRLAPALELRRSTRSAAEDRNPSSGPSATSATNTPSAPARSAYRRVPDRRSPGALLDGDRQPVRNGRPKPGSIAGTPARRRNLEDPGVIEGTHRRIEIRVCPCRCQFGGADAVGVFAFGGVNGVADGRQLAGLRIRLALAAQTTSNIFSRCLPFASTQPLTTWIRSRLPLFGSMLAMHHERGACWSQTSDRHPSARHAHSPS